jgi:hypothetical protein
MDMSEEGRPDYDEARAINLVGRSVLIGLTYIDENGEVTNRRQLHGTIVGAHKTKGFEIELAGERSGEIFSLPPDTRAFIDADPGEYQLRSTGEVVVDPDLISTWTITEGDYSKNSKKS